jgi:glycerophosphoryl diester phosphodiesterase
MLFNRLTSIALWTTLLVGPNCNQMNPQPLLIAHRGASAYAPEHTIAAYRLAIQQGADFIEQDIQISRDGILVCLHDSTLERTTNAEDVFPNRYRTDSDGEKHWHVVDFTLAELKRLDAGSWFDRSFENEKIPTFLEAIRTVRKKAGIFPELKKPELYSDHGFSVEEKLLELLKEEGLDKPGSDPTTPVIIQSFSDSCLKRLRLELATDLPLVFLLSVTTAKQWGTAADLERITQFANGIGPNKQVLLDNPSLVELAHETGLTVTPYTFRTTAVSPQFADVKEEMSYFLFTLKVDSLFTDNPDLFPRQ